MCIPETPGNYAHCLSLLLPQRDLHACQVNWAAKVVVEFLESLLLPVQLACACHTQVL